MKTAEEIRAGLAKACAAAGGRKAWAFKAGVSQAYICDILKGKREPGQAISVPLGYRPVTMYERIAVEEAA